ncbi:hypothetical protein [Emticicia sp. W12TSBA100-4]|uniref:hypothetical protein n=1 Tax=Emticicia sp. W12TSBA100-4 TaxID=3160965 RepID=UPI003305A81E
MNAQNECRTRNHCHVYGKIIDSLGKPVEFVSLVLLTNQPQMVCLNFSYRFGKIDMSLFKRQNMKSQQEGMQNGMQMQ